MSFIYLLAQPLPSRGIVESFALGMANESCAHPNKSRHPENKVTKGSLKHRPATTGSPPSGGTVLSPIEESFALSLPGVASRAATLLAPESHSPVPSPAARGPASSPPAPRPGPSPEHAGLDGRSARNATGASCCRVSTNKDDSASRGKSGRSWKRPRDLRGAAIGRPRAHKRSASKPPSGSRTRQIIALHRATHGLDVKIPTVTAKCHARPPVIGELVASSPVPAKSDRRRGIASGVTTSLTHRQRCKAAMVGTWWPPGGTRGCRPPGSCAGGRARERCRLAAIFMASGISTLSLVAIDDNAASPFKNRAGR
jgi:hypothetical protein